MFRLFSKELHIPADSGNTGVLSPDKGMGKEDIIDFLGEDESEETLEIEKSKDEKPKSSKETKDSRESKEKEDISEGDEEDTETEEEGDESDEDDLSEIEEGINTYIKILEQKNQLKNN